MRVGDEPDAGHASRDAVAFGAGGVSAAVIDYDDLDLLDPGLPQRRVGAPQRLGDHALLVVCGQDGGDAVRELGHLPTISRIEMRTSRLRRPVTNSHQPAQMPAAKRLSSHRLAAPPAAAAVTATVAKWRGKRSRSTTNAVSHSGRMAAR